LHLSDSFSMSNRKRFFFALFLSTSAGALGCSSAQSNGVASAAGAAGINEGHAGEGGLDSAAAGFGAAGELGGAAGELGGVGALGGGRQAGAVGGFGGQGG
jgi:hypothetical protein